MSILSLPPPDQASDFDVVDSFSISAVPSPPAGRRCGGDGGRHYAVACTTVRSPSIVRVLLTNDDEDEAAVRPPGSGGRDQALRALVAVDVSAAIEDHLCRKVELGGRCPDDGSTDGGKGGFAWSVRGVSISTAAAAGTGGPLGPYVLRAVISRPIERGPSFGLGEVRPLNLSNVSACDVVIAALRLTASDASVDVARSEEAVSWGASSIHAKEDGTCASLIPDCNTRTKRPEARDDDPDSLNKKVDRLLQMVATMESNLMQKMNAIEELLQENSSRISTLEKFIPKGR